MPIPDAEMREWMEKVTNGHVEVKTELKGLREHLDSVSGKADAIREELKADSDAIRAELKDDTKEIEGTIATHEALNTAHGRGAREEVWASFGRVVVMVAASMTALSAIVGIAWKFMRL